MRIYYPINKDPVPIYIYQLTSSEIATKIQNEMTYPGQVKITVIRETRSVAYAK